MSKCEICGSERGWMPLRHDDLKDAISKGFDFEGRGGDLGRIESRSGIPGQFWHLCLKCSDAVALAIQS